jgi:myo-inositol-1(or 4)-monophosphatase
MPPSHLPDDLAALVEAVLAGARAASRARGGEVEDQVKGDGSLVTEVDLALQGSLTRELARRWPGIPVLGEESDSMENRKLLDELRGEPGDVPMGAAAPAGAFWCMDPLDGTSNFVAGFPFYAVSVALVDGEGPRLGVVHDLARGETFASARNAGAWLGERRLTSADGAPAELAEAMALVDLKRLPPGLATRVATEHPFRSQRNLGSSALEWCWVAAGRCHLYLHGAQRPWDYAAGMLILSEAGGSSVLRPESVGAGAFDLQARQVVAAASPRLLAAWDAWVRREATPPHRP